MSLNKYKEIYQQKRDYSIGVEEEFMICNPKSGDLINKANEIMECVSNKDRYSYELLLSEIETNTPICKTVDKAIESLSEQRLELKKIQVIVLLLKVMIFLEQYTVKVKVFGI